MRLDLDKFLDEMQKSLDLTKKELDKFGGLKIPQGIEEGIKFWSIVGAKMALELVREAAANSKIHEEDSDAKELGIEGDQELDGERDILSTKGRIPKRSS